MSSSPETKLYRTTVLTFEELGFMLPSQELTPEQKAAPVDAAVSVDFEGCFSGRVVLAVSGGVLPRVVSNMLGEEEAYSLEAQYDALGEMANVLCGNLLPELAGRREIFSLRPPRLVDAASVKQQGEANAEIHMGLDDDGRADAYLFVTGNIPAHVEEDPS